jgi:ABC-2 type transport system ATP-binding protein
MIETTDLRVDYDDVTAVEDLSVTIGAGEVFGLIGPNGAGKTSTIRVMATLQRPTYGEVRIAGVDIAEDPRSVHKVLGYMPDNPPVYGDLRCWEFLDLFAGAYFVDRRDRRRRVDELLDQVGLNGKRSGLAGTLSTGMRQRLVLAKTLLPDPKVLLLDEPASGLDPLARIDLRELLKKEAARGKTILVSSHILTELSTFCTSIGIMEKGRLLESGTIDEIVARLNRRKRLVVEVLETGRIPEAAELEKFAHVSAVEARGSVFAFDFAGGDEDVVELLRAMVNAGLPIRSFTEKRMGVEDILLHVGAKEVS